MTLPPFFYKIALVMLVRYSLGKNGKAVKKALVYTKTEHNISRALVDGDAQRVIRRLKDCGYDAFMVGGAVRDLMSGRRPKDFDIVTSAEPPVIKKIFRNSRIIGKRFRLVHVFYPDKIFEVSTFRSIKNGSIGNEFGTMDEDVLRRDFTINALYYDPEREQVIDYVGGVKDLRLKRLSSIIPVKVIFKEDPVRMLRAIKYAVMSGCEMQGALRKELARSARLLQTVSPSRLTEEIVKIVNSGRAHDIIQETLKYDLFMDLQYGASFLMDDCEGFAESYEQSLKSLDEAQAAGLCPRLGDRLAFLLRDFVRMIADWKGEPLEVFSAVYAECRRFILPMNPPRVELEHAVLRCLAEGGIAPPKKKKRTRRVPVFKGTKASRTLGLEQAAIIVPR